MQKVYFAFNGLPCLLVCGFTVERERSSFVSMMRSRAQLIPTSISLLGEYPDTMDFLPVFNTVSEAADYFKLEIDEKET